MVHEWTNGKIRLEKAHSDLKRKTFKRIEKLNFYICLWFITANKIM